MDDIVEVRNITKFYSPDVHALSSINLSFPRGQMTTLLGPSGCGKTTLLKIIAGLLEPTEGEVFVNGNRSRYRSGTRIRVSGFRPFALGNCLEKRRVRSGADQTEQKRARERARHYINEVGLRVSKTSIRTSLSGGMRQRVGLARALAVNSDVLLMDEPFSAVDEQTRRKFQEDLLQLLANENKIGDLRHALASKRPCMCLIRS